MVDEGADVIDIGAESTRPGAIPVQEAEEARRLLPVIEAVAKVISIPISVDTMKPLVACAAIGAGATIWNDVTALRFAPDSLQMAAQSGCDVVLMHMQGEPSTMQASPSYGDVVAEVVGFLSERVAAAIAAGVAPDRIWLDPGIGFGKSARHSLKLLAGLGAVVALGFPVLVGASRKGFIRACDPTAIATAERLPGSLAAAMVAAGAGAAAVRVHDVAATRQALEVWAAIERARA